MADLAREPSKDRDALPPVPPSKHLLSLKVLRAARPRLAVQDGPYLEDNSLTDGALSRVASSSTDFAASSMLSLPSAFGTIYLGQEFHGVLAVQNDSGVGEGLEEAKGKTAQAVEVKVEMQMQNTKTSLSEVGPKAMEPGEAVDLAVKHEIREQGPHALVATVSYVEEVHGEDGQVQRMARSFRKLYRFNSTNPLSVKTKVFSPLSSSKSSVNSVLSPTERQTTFLEVQVANQSAQHMTFEHVRFDPADGLRCDDVNGASPLLSRQMAYLAPDDVSQFLFRISPVPSPTFVPPPAPGSVLPLGRLDIVWRSPHGEIGRLQTSNLTRRMPPAAPGPGLAAAVASTANTAAPGPRNPLRSVVSSPPPPPNVPYSPRAPPVKHAPPAPPLPPPPPPAPTTAMDWTAELWLDLVVTRLDHASLAVDQPFDIVFALRIISSPKPTAKLLLAVQTVRHPPPSSFPPTAEIPVIVTAPAARQPGTPVAADRMIRQTSLESPSLARLRRVAHPSTPPRATAAIAANDAASDADTLGGLSDIPLSSLPPPYPLPSSQTPYAVYQPSTRGAGLPSGPSPDVIPLGSSLVKLPSLTQGDDGCEFTVTYLPLSPGFANIGGLRVLLLKVDEGDDAAGGSEEGVEGTVVKEWDVVAQVFVRAAAATRGVAM